MKNRTKEKLTSKGSIKKRIEQVYFSKDKHTLFIEFTDETFIVAEIIWE